MAKLSQDVLGAVPEKQFSLEDIQFVLSDALVLLACKESKRSITRTLSLTITLTLTKPQPQPQP